MIAASTACLIPARHECRVSTNSSALYASGIPVPFQTHNGSPSPAGQEISTRIFMNLVSAGETTGWSGSTFVHNVATTLTSQNGYLEPGPMTITTCWRRCCRVQLGRVQSVR